MSYRFSATLLAMASTLATAFVMADPGNGNGVGQSKMYGKGNPFTVDNLPPGRTRAKLESLPKQARSRAMGWLHQFAFPESDLESLVIDDEGGVFYIDPAPEPVAAAEQTTGVEGALPEPAASAADDAFLLHSRFGAQNVVYLDFDGHSFSNTAWSSGTIQARAYDLDGDPSTFNEAERNAIAEIWHRVAEDLAAFDIDVTTEEPSSFGRYTGRVLITSRTDANGGAMPYNTGGGVAYVNVWGYSNYASYYSPALVYYDNLAKGTTYIAEASAHEFGHNLGLSHDGTSSVTYYTGHGSGDTSWAPIMGNSYYNNVTQWSKGEYAGANNTQDDIAVIAGKLYLTGDEHGDTLNNATPLDVDGGGQILVSNPETDPHNFYPANKGVIDTPDDQDVFYFGAAAGQVDITVTPAWDAFHRTSKRGANLDIRAILQDSDGATLATSSPTANTHASISVSVPGGTYYLTVSGVGNGNYSAYASRGQYFIEGSVPPGSGQNTPPSADFGFACMDLSCSFTDGSSDSDGSITSWAWNFGDGNSSNAQSPNHTYGAAGGYTVTLTVTDTGGAMNATSKSVTVTSPDTTPPSITAPVDVTAEASGTSAMVDLGSPSVSDDQDPNPTVSNDAPATFPIGTTTVTWTATDASGNAATATQMVTVTEPPPQPPTAQPPAAPTGLSAAVEKSGKGKNKVVTRITLNWSDNSDNETHFSVQGCQEVVSGKGRNRTVTCNFSELGTVDANATELDVPPDSGNRFRVKAVNSHGPSAYCNEVKI